MADVSEAPQVGGGGYWTLGLLEGAWANYDVGDTSAVSPSFSFSTARTSTISSTFFGIHVVATALRYSVRASIIETSNSSSLLTVTSSRCHLECWT